MSRQVDARIVRDGVTSNPQVGILVTHEGRDPQEVIRLEEHQAKRLRNRLNAVLSMIERDRSDRS